MTGCTANAHYLLNIRPAGEWPAEYFYYAGGVPAIMEEIRDCLHLDVRTVTGKTLGENLQELKENGFYERCDSFLKKTGLQRRDVIRPYDEAFDTNGSIAIFKGQPGAFGGCCETHRSAQRDAQSRFACPAV